MARKADRFLHDKHSQKQLDLISQEREKKEQETKDELDNLADKETKLRTAFEKLQKELATKQQEIEILRKPWWKKWFLPSEAESS